MWSRHRGILLDRRRKSEGSLEYKFKMGRIWNNVFVGLVFWEGKFEGLAKKCRYRYGTERTLAVLNGLDDNYKTDLFIPIGK